MKILMTTDAVGGVWHYAIDLVKSLLEAKFEVVLVCTGPAPRSSQQDQVKRLKGGGMSFYHSPYQLEWEDDPWEDIYRANQWLREIFKIEKPSLLHFNNYAPAGLDWAVPTILVAHSCVASWWQAVKHEPLPDRYKRYFNTVQQAFRKADSVIFPSHALLESCHELYGDIHHPEVIYNGITFPLAEPLYEFSNKMPIIFSMGRLWDEAKNIDLLLKAAPYIDGEIFIAGDKSKDFSCPGNVRFLGELTRQQVMNWLKMSAVYVLPVKYEPFGLSFLEAASCQCALVGGDIATLREIWGGSMTYIQRDTADDLANICNRLLTNPSESRRKGEEAYRCARKYSLNNKTDHYLEVYRKCLGTTIQLT